MYMWPIRQWTLTVPLTLRRVRVYCKLPTTFSQIFTSLRARVTLQRHLYSIQNMARTHYHNSLSSKRLSLSVLICMNYLPFKLIKSRVFWYSGLFVHPRADEHSIVYFCRFPRFYAFTCPCCDLPLARCLEIFGLLDWCYHCVEFYVFFQFEVSVGDGNMEKKREKRLGMGAKFGRNFLRPSPQTGLSPRS